MTRKNSVTAVVLAIVMAITTMDSGQAFWFFGFHHHRHYHRHHYRYYRHYYRHSYYWRYGNGRRLSTQPRTGGAESSGDNRETMEDLRTVREKLDEIERQLKK